MKFIFSFVLIFLLFAIVAPVVYAIGTQNDCPKDQVCLQNPLNVDSPQKLIGVIIKGGLGVVGSIALALFIYGGFRWMLSAGNPEGVKAGKDIILYAILGLIIIFSAYALTTFVLTNLLGVET